MSIAAADLICYNAASRPEANTTTSGGAIDTASRPGVIQLTANAVIAVISDGADTRTVTVTGRLATGAIDTEIITLDGTNEVLGLKTFERILKLVLSASSGSRTVTVKQGSGGSVRATIGLNETSSDIRFQRSSSLSGSTDFYEKIFWKNTHGTLTLNDAAVMLTADPDSRIFIGLDTAINATVSVANRLTAPGGVTFVDDSVSQTVPGGVLAAGDRIGVWAKMTLPGDDPPHKTTFTTQLTGSTI